MALAACIGSPPRGQMGSVHLAVSLCCSRLHPTLLSYFRTFARECIRHHEKHRSRVHSTTKSPEIYIHILHHRPFRASHWIPIRARHREPPAAASLGLQQQQQQQRLARR